MKKVLLFLLVVVISVFMVTSLSLAGCKAQEAETTEAETTVAEATAAETIATETTSAETTAPVEKIKLVFSNWAGAEKSAKETMDKGLAKYAEVNPNVEIEQLIIPWEQTREQLITMAMAGNPPDIMLLQPSWVYELGPMGALLPVQDYLDPAVMEDYYPTTLEGNTYDGNLFALPWFDQTHSIWYNKRIFAEAGISSFPTTIDEFMDACAKIKAKFGDEVYPIGISNAQDSLSFKYMLYFMWSFGAFPLEGGVNWNTPEMKNFYTWLREMYDKEYTTPVGVGSREIRELLTKEKVAMHIVGPFMEVTMTAIDNTKVGQVIYDNFSIANVPLMDPNGTVAAVAEALSLGISKQCKYPDEAVGVCQTFINDVDTIKNLYLYWNGIPPMKSQATGDIKFYFDQNPIAKLHLEQALPIARMAPLSPKWAGAESIIEAKLQEIISEKPIDQLLQETEEALQVYYGNFFAAE